MAIRPVVLSLPLTVLLSLPLTMVITAKNADGEDLRTLARSPFAIEDYLQTHKELNVGDLWKGMGLPERITDPHLPRQMAQDFYCRADSPCEVWLQSLQLSADRTRFVALRLTQPAAQLSRYLIFRHELTQWKLVGHIDSGFAKYFDPVLYARELGGKWWLVLTEQSGSGTGYEEAIQRWFELKNNHLREVLSFLDHAYLLCYPGEFVLRPVAVAVGFEQTASSDLLRVQYRLSFTLVDDDGIDRASFGSIEKEAVYRRFRSEIDFRLDATKGLSQDEILKTYQPNLGHDIASKFLRIDLNNLLQIASGHSSIEKQWLLENVRAFPSTDARTAIIETLWTEPQN